MLLHDRLDFGHDFGLTETGRRVGRDRHLAATVRTVDLGRAFAFGECDEIREWNGDASHGRHRKDVERFNAVSVRFFLAEVNVILLAAFVISRNIVTTHEESQCRGEVGDVNAHLSGLASVHDGAQLGFALDQG